MPETSSMKNSLTAAIPSSFGEASVTAYKDEDTMAEHVLCVYGSLQETPIVRIHSECFTGDLLGSYRCDCGDQLKQSLALIKKEKNGILIYLRQEGRGIGLGEKLNAYLLQDEGLDTIEANKQLGHEADARDYSVAVKMLKDCNIKQVRLITNNPEKIKELEQEGIKVVEIIKLDIQPNKHNQKYIETKKEKFLHKY